jgi:hypothetical protein
MATQKVFEKKSSSGAILAQDAMGLIGLNSA